ncbi:hypothetical protein [Ruania alba]|uniref:Fibronectin type-III domain-containing protein n=1 Tax=Ruania alba TaxID=648782 RepID=A0A1H5LG09_9MICO|nr:hypothetical protein [Ruania alba]SEE75960.1 hypothetical protein SAMN04488554_2792 [Ruania alba]
MTTFRTLRTRLAAAVVGLVLVAATVATGTAQPTTAAWTDSEHARAAVTASTLNAPRANGCSVPLLSPTATLRWLAPSPAPGAAYTYRWELIRTATGTVVRSGSDPSTTSAREVSTSELVSLATTYTFRIRTVSGTWESTWRTATVTTILGALGLTLIGSCSWN